ncbi:50S ribosomal protein L25 [Candidatus Uhrbacteria bacterium]|nr:50S ribosomal protein L25 [Candidatus Uhrbacteria bacterium]
MQEHSYILQAQVRDLLGKKAQSLRSNAQIPAVVYGPGVDNQNLTLDARSFEKVYRAAGESSLVQLVIGAVDATTVLIHDVAREPLTGRVIHVDLYRVNMAEKLTTHIPLHFTNESRAVKELGGILIKNMSEIEVRCLPKNLVPEIDVSLEPLTELESSIKIKDVVLPVGIEASSHHAPDDIIVIVTPPVSEDELRKMDEQGAVSAPAEIAKSEEKGKKTEE